MNTPHTAEQHDLFRRFPLDQHIELNGESLSSPYHVYDGHLLMLGGHVDGAVAAARLPAGQYPLLDEQGRALAAIWLGDFTEANLGAHHELQFSLFASTQSLPPRPTHPLRLFHALMCQPVHMVCQHLWNNTQRVVSFNRDHLLLDAQLTHSQLRCQQNRWQGDYRDAADAPLAQFDLAHSPRQPGAVLWRILGQIGMRGWWRSVRSPILNVPVCNTLREGIELISVSQTWSQPRKQIIRLAQAEDRVELLAPSLSAYDFRLDFVQQIEGFRFVYQRPTPF
ncbi:hypothetical protein [Leeia aquatica]|uniref:Uncharacterized protein n=1 Tax=Leeia aquatica TaxID=2725557 RepID=A0A847SEX9_9NEIS|nr:hypothetical protein [Leeia aquatica]NLR75839.1 hypothetical protein [Leeia aquatica]